MKKVLFLAIILLNVAALAAGGEHHGETSVPAGTVISQIVNVGLLIAIIYFWQGKAIAQAFKDKRENFLKSVEEASQSKMDAENKKKEVDLRVKELKNNFQKDISEAKKNAEESYRTQMADAKNEALKITETALGSLENEIQKEIENLRLETYKKSAGLAKEQLGKKLSPEQQKAWNTHFANEVKGAH